MKNENIQKWVDEMRTTDKPQGEGALARRQPDGRYAYCCLGLGCELAQIESADRGGMLAFGPNRHKSLAPREFVEWLGIATKGGFTDYDVWPDWGKVGQLKMPSGDFLGSLAASGMNDTGFTFAQIADVFDYFGVECM